jgi:hypothetical protein
VNRTIGLTMLLLGIAGYAFAGVSTPEIDGSSAVAGVALLSGGMVVLWGRRRAK